MVSEVAIQGEGMSRGYIGIVSAKTYEDPRREREKRGGVDVSSHGGGKEVVMRAGDGPWMSRRPAR